MTPKDDHTDRQALWKFQDLLWESGLWEELNHDQLIKLDKVIDAYTEQRELLAIKATTDKMVTDFNNVVTDHRGDKDIDRHEFVVGLLWGVAAAISIPVDKRLAQLKASTSKGEAE